MSESSTTLSHRREEGDEHIFEWEEPNGDTCRFGFESRWLLLQLAIGHFMRGCVWGQG